MEDRVSLIITLPEDEGLKALLQAKLAEYRSRLDRFQHPELQAAASSAAADAFFKEAVLSKLLKDGEVDTQALSLKLREVITDAERLALFNNACGVVWYYCTNGRAGLGLQEGVDPARRRRSVCVSRNG
jgi:hypothetical protein